MSEPRLYPGSGPDERTPFTPYGAFEVPADLRELFGRFDVEATARRIRNFRYAEEWTMLMLGGWLATIPERAAIRIALGARPCEALNRAALALEHWLQAALPHASGPSAGWSGAASSAPGAFSPAQERTRVTFLVTPTPEAVTIRSG